MALIKSKPNTPGTRQLVLVDRKGLWKGKSLKKLTVGLSKPGGRNNKGLNLNGIKADFVNESYGDHKRNKFDIWLAESEKPTPLVIYIHGGGFSNGDKSNYYNSKQLVRFLEKDFWKS